MVEPIVKALGAKDWNAGDRKVSSSRVVMYCAFALVAAALVWAGLRLSIWGQSYDELKVWVEDVVSGAKWFLAPYGASAARDAVVGRKEPVS